MSLETFYSRAGHLIRRLNQITVAIYLQETETVGLTTVQFAALEMIDEVPNIDQASLSAMIAFDKTTILKVIEKLLDKGLISRTRSVEDRRSNKLHVTPKGRDALRKVGLVMDRIEQRILASLPAEDQRKFLEMLTQLVHVNNIYSRAPLDAKIWGEAVAKQKKRGSGAKRGGRSA